MSRRVTVLPQTQKPGGRCSVASLGTAKIGLGAQVGFNVKVDGIASLHGDINLWSKSQSSDEWFGRTEQSFGGGLSVAGIGVLVDSRRSVKSFSNQSLSSAGWEGPNPSVVVGFGSRIPGASPELSAPGHDLYFGIGVKALAGLELQINLSEGRRRLFGGDDCP
jgi:hypothetical protein